MSGTKDVAGALSPVHRARLELCHRPVAARLVRVRAACLSTLAVVKRETNSWRYPLYIGAVSVRARVCGRVPHYRVALLLGGGAALGTAA